MLISTSNWYDLFLGSSDVSSMSVCNFAGTSNKVSCRLVTTEVAK